LWFKGEEFKGQCTFIVSQRTSTRLTLNFLKKEKKLKDKSGVKWIWDMFNMITKWDVHLGAKK
jgi:hypothetical protein